MTRVQRPLSPSTIREARSQLEAAHKLLGSDPAADKVDSILSSLSSEYDPAGRPTHQDAGPIVAERARQDTSGPPSGPPSGNDGSGDGNGPAAGSADFHKRALDFHKQALAKAQA